MQPTKAGEYILDAVKAAPPVVVTSTIMSGENLQAWVMIATLVYTVLQIVWFVYDKLTRRRSSGRK